MPYDGQGGSKISHHEVLERHPLKPLADVVKCKTFVGDCRTLSRYTTASETNGELRDLLIALDGSLMEVPVDEDYPSRKLGFIKSPVCC